ncbi:MAG: LPS-assembly protein LptD, partial [Alloalcanivorax venustensis]
MPLPSRLFLPGLALLLAGAAGADDDLNWVDRDTMTALPPVQQRPIPVWCSGIYYNPSVGVPADQSDIIITADSTSLTEDGLISMDGEVLIERPGRRLTSQSALLDQSSGKFEVANSLRLETDQFTFIADGMSGQTQRREASLNRVRYALFGPGARGTAEHIDLVENFTTIERGTYTTCAPGSNGWELSGRQIRLDREEGWGEARDVTLRVKGMPLLWLPWITFPIDERRKTGLLFPTITTSDSGGVSSAPSPRERM